MLWFLSDTASVYEFSAPKSCNVMHARKKVFQHAFLEKTMMNKLSFYWPANSLLLFAVLLIQTEKLRNVLLVQGTFGCFAFPYLRFRSDVSKIRYTNGYVWFLKKEARKREENSVV